MPIDLSWILTVIVLTISGVATGGVGVSIVNGVFRRPKEKVLTEKERVLIEKEKELIEKEEALRDAIKSDSNLKLIKIWMDSNDKLVESNNRLERSNKDLQRYGREMQRDMRREMNELKTELAGTQRQLITAKQTMTSLVTILERFTPLFPDVCEDEDERQQWITVLQRARHLNG